jgi:hypothetical protein
MKRSDQVNKVPDRIADAIVDLVERTDGPVTLAQVEREIPGFAKEDPPAWSQMLVDGLFLWDGMTEAGCAALARQSQIPQNNPQRLLWHLKRLLHSKPCTVLKRSVTANFRMPNM